MKDSEWLELKEKAEKKKEQYYAKKGELTSIKQELKQKFGITTLKQGTQLAKKMWKEIETLETKLNEAIEEIKEEFDL